MNVFHLSIHNILTILYTLWFKILYIYLRDTGYSKFQTDLFWIFIWTLISYLNIHPKLLSVIWTFISSFICYSQDISSFLSCWNIHLLSHFNIKYNCGLMKKILNMTLLDKPLRLCLAKFRSNIYFSCYCTFSFKNNFSGK